MPAERIPMLGATLKLDGTEIDGVMTIDDIVPRSRAAIGVTALADDAIQTVKGQTDFGSLTWTMMFDLGDATHQALMTQFANNRKNDTVLTVTLDNTAQTTLQVTGPLMKLGTKGGDATSGKFMANGELKINSLIETA